MFWGLRPLYHFFVLFSHLAELLGLFLAFCLLGLSRPSLGPFLRMAACLIHVSNTGSGVSSGGWLSNSILFVEKRISVP